MLDKCPTLAEARHMTTTQTDATDRAAFLADAKATASRAGLPVPERLAYVDAEAARYDAMRKAR
jgi:hypothetical protein